MPRSSEIWISAQTPVQHPAWPQGHGAVCTPANIKPKSRHAAKELQKWQNKENKEWHSLSELNTLIYGILRVVSSVSQADQSTGQTSMSLGSCSWFWPEHAEHRLLHRDLPLWAGIARGPHTVFAFQLHIRRPAIRWLISVKQLLQTAKPGFLDCGKLNDAYLLMW